MNSNQIRFYRNDSVSLELQVNEGRGWKNYKSSALLKRSDWQTFKKIRTKDKTIQESFIVIQFGLKHKYEIISANANAKKLIK